MAWPCFWVVESGEVELWLRRFVHIGDAEPPCPNGYHNDSALAGRVPRRMTDNGHWDSIDAAEFAGDPRWPTACPCGYRFTDDDHWQVNQEPIYHHRDRAGEWTQRELPVGAVFDSRWMPDEWKGPDGRAITVVLPDLCDGAGRDARSHFWNVDGPASPGDGKLIPHAWTRHGDPDNLPTFSVTPSIDARGSNYHGYLTAGMLVDPL